MKLTILLRVIGFIQIVLGILYLFAPAFFLESMGHSIPEADIFYPLAMLSARFIAYGLAFIYISKEAIKHKPWIYFMILIQAIDLSAGIFYTATGVISLELSGFAMFNATWIMILLYLFSNRSSGCLYGYQWNAFQKGFSEKFPDVFLHYLLHKKKLLWHYIVLIVSKQILHFYISIL